MAGYLSAVNLIAGAGILGNIGGVPISANSNVLASINSYDSLSVVTQFANVKSSGNSVLAANTMTSLNNLAGNIFPAVTDSVPSAYISLLGNTPVAGFSGLISTEVNNLIGNGDLGKFDQVFNLADSYRVTTNQLINSSVNANNSAANSTYTTQDNIMSGGISQISQAYQQFGPDLAALGYSIDFTNLSNLGSPQALLKQINVYSGGGTILDSALISAGVSATSLENIDTPMSGETQKIVFDVMSKTTGNTLTQILKILKVTTIGIGTLADLLNPVKMFPNSFNTLTAPTTNGLRGIYINSSGAINSALETILPSNVLAPLQGYATVQNTYAQLKKIIPADWALANKALQAGFEQVKSIFDSNPVLLGASVTGLESNKGLNIINGLPSPIPTDVTNFYKSTYSSGSGDNGTLLLADIIGSVGGWVVTGNLTSATTILSSMTTAGSLATLTNGTTGVFTVMQNVIDSIYGDIANAITIPGGLPGAGNYGNGNAAFTGPGTPGIGLIPAAYSLIGNIVANNVSNVTVANSNWSNIAAQLYLESSTQASAGIVFANLVPGTQPQSLATNVGQFGLDTSAGGTAWLFESVANTSTQGGQAIISSMRESRNQVLLQNASINTDIVVSDAGIEPQSNTLSSGQYTASEAAAQKII